MRHFIREFLRAPCATGAIAASSSGLASVMAGSSKLPGAKVVVELGSGTGVFTEQIVRKLSNGTVFFVLEINPRFVEKTRKRCPDVLIYNDCATNIGNYLKKHGFEKCDCIISGLPFGMFGDDHQRGLLGAISGALSPDGEFLTFSYVGAKLLPAARRFKRNLRNTFGSVSQLPVVWRNIPPAIVYRCVSPGSQTAC